MVNKLRAFVFIDRLQPQIAVAFAAGSNGFLPIGGQAALMVEVEPGILINQAMDFALKSSNVRPGKAFIERHFGLLELHADALADVKHAGNSILNGLGVKESDIPRPKILSSQIIRRVNPYHAQMINIHRNASLLMPGTDLFTMECEPAAYIVRAANEIEKNTPVTLVDCNEVGAVGRLSVSGTSSQVERAAETAKGRIGFNVNPTLAIEEIHQSEWSGRIS